MRGVLRVREWAGGQRVRVIVGAALLVVAMIAAVPFVLTALYAVVDPPSLTVLRRAVGGSPVSQRLVPLEEIAPAAARAVIVSEDARFCLHYGIDLNQVRVVMRDALAGEDPRGASTITMQTVKNLFLWSDRSYLRKALEIPLALWLDLVLSKDRILEIYLNIAQWGPDVFGIEAAARRYFAKPAAALTQAEAFALARTLPAPATRDPRRLSARQQRIARRLADDLRRAPWIFSCLSERLRP